MTFILFIAVIGLIAYALNLSSRIQRLEQQSLTKSPASKTSTDLSEKKAVLATPITPSINQARPMTKTAGSVPTQPTQSMDSHSFINLLPKVGIVALVIGLGFFLKYAIDEGWISITLRLVMGGLIGTLFLILFYVWRQKYEKYALVLAGGGLAIWYLTVWAAVQLYSVLAPDAGLVLLTIVSLAGILLAYKTGSKALSVISWGGAYLVPMILGIGNNQFGLLLIYLTVLNIALMVTVLYNRALYLFFLALFGSVINIIWTSSSRITMNTIDDQILAFLFVNLVIFSTIFVFSIRNEIEKYQKSENETEYGLVAGIVYSILLIPIAAISYNSYFEFAPVILLAVGVWMFVIYTFIDRLEYSQVNYVISGLGSALFSLAIFWHFGSSTEILMMYILGLVGLVIGRVQNRVELRSWSMGVVMVGILASIFFEYMYGAEMLLMSEKFILEILGVITLVISYFVIRKDQVTKFEDSIHTGLQYVIAFLLWFYVSWDLINYFGAYELTNQKNLSLSTWWIIYAIVLIGLSTVAAMKPLRKLGLFLIGLTIVKVFLYDVQSLDTVYRIVSFVSLGAILLVFSFIYQHNKEKIKDYLN